MKRLSLFLVILVLLLAVSCNSDGALYRYDGNSYLGVWEMEFAEIQGDVDGCTHLLQINLKKDMSFTSIEYTINTKTNNISIDVNNNGSYTYNKQTGAIVLAGEANGTANYSWTLDNGLSLLFGGVKYQFYRPKYELKESDDQSAITGIWELRNDNEATVGKDITQLVINEDGSADVYWIDGVSEAVHECETREWYLNATTKYSETHSQKWDLGSEVINGGLSVTGHQLHEKAYYFTVEEFETTVNGLVVDDNEGNPVNTDVYQYKLYDFGSQKFVKVISINGVASGLTLVKVSNVLDLTEKNNVVVKPWNGLLGNLYLRSDGTFSTAANYFNKAGLSPAGGYFGKYVDEIAETDMNGYLELFEKELREQDPATYNDAFDWATWRTNWKTTNYDPLIAADENIKFYKGTIEFNHENGFAETYEVSIMVETDKYGTPGNEPVVFYSMRVRRGKNDYFNLVD